MIDRQHLLLIDVRVQDFMLLFYLVNVFTHEVINWSPMFVSALVIHSCKFDDLIFLSILKNQISKLKRDENYQEIVSNDELMHSSALASDLMQLIYHTVIEQSSSRYHQLTEDFFGNEDDYVAEEEHQPETLCDRIFGA